MMVGTEPVWAQGGPGPLAGAGILFCHGFSGSPASVRSTAEHLAAQGAAVACPLLPGHGTSWQQLALTTHEDWYSVLPPALDWLRDRSHLQVVAGLSMGGALALRVAELEQVAAVVLVNPSIGSDSLAYRLVPLLSKVLPSLRGIGSDIKAAGVIEPAYPRTPLAAVTSLRQLWRLAVDDLDLVTVPVLMFTSRTDHVVDGYSGRLLRKRLPKLTDYWLDDSYHVATMDNDAAFINRTTARFISDLLRDQHEQQ